MDAVIKGMHNVNGKDHPPRWIPCIGRSGYHAMPVDRPEGGVLRCLQASPRGGELLVEYQGDRVRLTGKVEELRQA